MSRVLVPQMQEVVSGVEIDRSLDVDVIDEGMNYVARVVNGALDAGNVKRGTTFSLASGGWQEPNSLITLSSTFRGTAFSPFMLPLGFISQMAGWVPTAASCVAAVNTASGYGCGTLTFKVGATDIVTSLALTAASKEESVSLGTDGFAPYTTFTAFTKSFSAATFSVGNAVTATFSGTPDYATVSITFRVPHTS